MGRPETSAWNTEGMTDELVKVLHTMSVSHIASYLSRMFKVPVTRNAVMGKIARMGLNNAKNIDPKQPVVGQPKHPIDMQPGKKPPSKLPKKSKIIWTVDMDTLLTDLYTKRGLHPGRIAHMVFKAHRILVLEKDVFKRIKKLKLVQDESETLDRIEQHGVAYYDVAVEAQGVPLTEHRWLTCHWPTSADRLCGEKLYHRSYCCEHAHRAFQNMPRDKVPLGGVA